MTIHEATATSGDGRRILTGATGLMNNAGTKTGYVALEDEDGAELIKVFPFPESSPAYDFLDFIEACGLDEEEVQSGKPTLLIDRKVEVEVNMMEDGELNARTGYLRGKGTDDETQTIGAEAKNVGTRMVD